MRKIWRDHKLLVLAFLGVFGLAIYFGIGTFLHARDFRVAKEQPVAAWMTPRFVAHSWDIPRETMMTILDLEPPSPGRQTLAEIAEVKGVPVDAYIAGIEAGIAAFREDQER